MIRGIFLAATLSLGLATTQGAEPEKVQFKQTGNSPRDMPGTPVASPTPQEQGVAFQNYQDTLKAWRSARKRLAALNSVSKTLQNDPAADKEVVAMIQLMALEKIAEAENLRAQLAALLITNKLEDPALPREEREQIIIHAAR